MSKLKPIPLSKAKTAYGLVRDVQRAILAEPRRANMGVYADTVDVDDEDAPACGTVGCFAGWVNVLSKGRVTALDADEKQAVETLGHDLNYFLSDRYNYVFNAGAGDRCAKTWPGTEAHARAVAIRIEGFIKRNLKALKARKLVTNPDGTLSPAPGQD